MSIQTEVVGTFDYKRKLVRVYSDVGLQIRKVGTDEVYPNGEAIDVEGVGYIYEELPMQVVRDYEERPFQSIQENI